MSNKISISPTKIILLFSSFKQLASYFDNVFNYSNRKIMVNMSVPIGDILNFIKDLGKEYKRRTKYYCVIWKKPHKIKQDKLLRTRKYKPYYYSRSTDKRILECLEKEQSILITGKPLIGKTRAVFEALKNVKKPYVVTIAKNININEKDFLFPRSLRFKKSKLVIIDDLRELVEKQNFQMLIEHIYEKKCVLLATCRSGGEFTNIEGSFASTPYSFSVLFGKENIIELEKIDKKAGKEIAKMLDIPWKNVEGGFDGTPGSILLELDSMKKRFDNCSFEEKTILRSLKKMHECGIYKEIELFSRERLKIVCQKEYDYEKLLEELQKKEFLELTKENVLAEEAYLETIVTYATKFTIFDLFAEMLETFQGIPEALVLLGNRSWFLSKRSKDTALLKISIQAYEESLKIHIIDIYPIQYAMTMNNLGNAYSGLADVRDKENNLAEAIHAYEEALKIYTLDNYPLDYAMTMNNLGTAYSGLADVREKENNLAEAIHAYEVALKIRNVDNYPLDYAMTMNNLGTAYSSLADVREKENNLAEAIHAFKAALKIRNVDNYPLDYATTMNNLGNAYSGLVDVRDKESNLAEAIHAFKAALKIYTLDNYPIQYAMTMNNLGTAYSGLADVREKENNLAEAIHAFKTALKIYTLDNYPIQYAGTMNNLGAAYWNLADIRDKESNLMRAIQAYKAALKIRTIDKYPIKYAGTMNNLGNAYWNLADVRDKESNLAEAIHAFEEALKIYTVDNYPLDYATTMYNLGFTFWDLAKEYDKKSNCMKADKAFQNALKIFTIETFPDYNKSTNEALKILSEFCQNNKK